MKKILIALAAILIIFTIANFAFSEVIDGLVGHWKFDDPENLGLDSSSYGNHGTVQESDVKYTEDGVINGAAKFIEGEHDEAISLPKNNSLKMKSEITIALWVNLDGKNTDWGNTILVSESGPSQVYALYTDLCLWSGCPLTACIGQNSIANYYNELPVKTWFHLVTIYKDSTIQFYIDTNLVYTKTFKEGLSDNNKGMIYIGTSPYGASEDFSGMMDDLRLYNRAISECNIKELYYGSSILKIYYRDEDQDGYGDPNDFVIDCEMPDGFVEIGYDCNDNDFDINPSVFEICDDLDNDCDGLTDEGFCHELTDTNMVISGSISLALDDVDLTNKYLIGVYTLDENNNPLCIGSSRINIDQNGASDFTILAHGDEDGPEIKNGALTDDPLVFKIFNDTENIYIDIYPSDLTSIYWTPHNLYTGVEFTNNYCQQIPLKKGWNLISFNINACFYDVEPDPSLIPEGVKMIDITSPEYKGLEHIKQIYKLPEDTHSKDENDNEKNLAEWLSSIIGSSIKRVSSFDNDGAHMLDVDIPSKFHTLHYMAPGYGYWFKVKKDTYFSLCGERIAPNTLITLINGWNLVGYLPNICFYDEDLPPACDFQIPTPGFYYAGPAVVNSMLDSIKGKYQRVSAFDTCNGGMLFDISVPLKVNTIHYMGPGYGYWIKMNEPGLLSYPGL